MQIQFAEHDLDPNEVIRGRKLDFAKFNFEVTPFYRGLAKRAWQLALAVLVPGGLIVLALMWWVEQKGNA